MAPRGSTGHTAPTAETVASAEGKAAHVDPKELPPIHVGNIRALSYVGPHALMSLSEFGDPNEVTLWNELDGKKVASRSFGPGPLGAFSSDGKWIAYLEHLYGLPTRFRLRLDSFSSGNTVAERIFTHEEVGYATALFVLRDGRTVIARPKMAEALDACVRVYSTGLVEESKRCIASDPIGALNLSPDGRFIVLSPFEGALRVVDSSSGAEVLTIPLPRGRPLTLFSSDGGRFAWANDKVVHILAVDGWREERQFEVETANRLELALDAKGDRLVVSEQTALYSVDLASNAKPRRARVPMEDFNDEVARIALSPDGERIAVVTRKGVLSYEAFETP